MGRGVSRRPDTLTDWDGYESFQPVVVGPLNRLTRNEALEVFRQRMDAKPDRIEMLKGLLEANGVELGTSDRAVQRLNDWFAASVEADPEQPGRLGPRWYSVANDLALFLGDVMIERHPLLHWEFFTWGKSNAAYQRHVVMGFSTEDTKFHTSIDIDRMVAGYAHRLVASQGSVARLGSVEVRGVTIDLDAAVTRAGGVGLEANTFVSWLHMAGARA